VIQAAIVLPLLLRWKGYSPLNMARGMMPALIVAFFSKSSGVALPMAMKCAEEGLQIQKRVSRFSFPLCVTINMNACAAFILTTVLFVSMSHGVMYSPLELIAWIFIATLAAVGNAGVPMGCYFLSTAFLVSMNVPLNIMGAIFPLYTVIDMLETAINVWSNGCVAAAVDADVRAEEEGSQEAVALGATAS
jgi:Na+/H+-dicarboxylate symporter